MLPTPEPSTTDTDFQRLAQNAVRAISVADADALDEREYWMTIYRNARMLTEMVKQRYQLAGNQRRAARSKG